MMRRLPVHAIEATGSRTTESVLYGDGRWGIPSGGSGGGGGLALLNKVSLTASASTIGFSSIPTTGYDHLRIMFVVRGLDATATTRSLHLALNGDTASSSYAAYYMQDNTETYVDGSSANARFVGIVPCAGSGGAPAGHAGVGEILIPDYATSDWFKAAQARAGLPGHPSIRQSVSETVWKNTAAVTSIDLTVAVGDFAAGSKAWLYGVA